METRIFPCSEGRSHGNHLGAPGAAAPRPPLALLQMPNSIGACLAWPGAGSTLCRALSEQVALAGFVPQFPQEVIAQPLPDPVLKRNWRHSHKWDVWAGTWGCAGYVHKGRILGPCVASTRGQIFCPG